MTNVCFLYLYKGATKKKNQYASPLTAKLKLVENLTFYRHSPWKPRAVVYLGMFALWPGWRSHMSELWCRAAISLQLKPDHRHGSPKVRLKSKLDLWGQLEVDITSTNKKRAGQFLQYNERVKGDIQKNTLFLLDSHNPPPSDREDKLQISSSNIDWEKLVVCSLLTESRGS